MAEEIKQISTSTAISDFLSSTYYVLSITIVCGGLIVWSVKQEARINDLEKEHARVDQKLDDFDNHGTRALSAQVALLQQQLTSLDQREVGATKNVSEQMNSIISSLNERISVISNRFTNQEQEIRKIGVIETRQIEVLRRLDILERKQGKMGDAFTNKLQKDTQIELPK